MSNEKISLRLPASAEYGRVTRAAAANLATRLGWQAVDIDSLRLAIDEALAVLTGHSAAGDGALLDIDFVIIGDGIEIDIVATGPDLGTISQQQIERFERLVTPSFATATVDSARHRVHIIKQV